VIQGYINSLKALYELKRRVQPGGVIAPGDHAAANQYFQDVCGQPAQRSHGPAGMGKRTSEPRVADRCGRHAAEYPDYAK